MNAAVFLDRDNTIIENDGDLGEPSKVRLLQGAASAIASLRGLGYRIVVVTNQGGVARGKYTEADVEAVHQRINDMVYANSGARIDRFYYCPFHPEGTVEKYRREHPWRKPQPGMLLRAAKDLDLDLNQCWMIGDAMRDVEAAATASVRAILLHPDAGANRPPLKLVPGRVQVGGSEQAVIPEYTARTLIEAVRIIAQQKRPDRTEETWERSEDRPVPPLRSAEATAVKANVIPAQERKPRVARPFRPWDAPPPEEGDEGADVAPGQPAKAPAGMMPKPGPTPSSATPESPPPAPPVSPTPTVKSVPTPPSAPPAPPPAPTPTAPSAESSPPAPSDTQPAAVVNVAPAADEPVIPPPPATSDPLIRQLLQEMRLDRAIRTEFSYLRMFAVVLQTLAVACLIGAFWLAGEDAIAVIRWMGVAIFVQLVTITALIFDR